MEKGDSSAVVKLQSAIKFNGGGSTFLLFNKLDFWLIKFDAFIR
jgi:hypothetical protein